MDELENFEQWEESEKDWPYDDEHKKKIFDTWNSAGLLDSMSEDLHNDMALSMETTASMAMNEIGVAADIAKSRFTTCVFAIMARILRALPELMTYDMVRNLYPLIYAKFKSHEHLIAELDAAPAMIDGEAEVCALVADEIIKMYNGGD